MTGRGGAAREGATTGRRPRAAVLALMAVFALLMVEALYPFKPQLPVWRRTVPERTASGSVRFDGRSILVSRSPPPWLTAVRDEGKLEVDLEVRAAQARQEGPARILTVSRDINRANLMIGQRDDDLVVRVRRPGSDGSGDPPFVVQHLLGDQGWHRIEVRLDRDRFVLRADGRPEADQGLGAAAVSGWDPGFSPSLGDEPQGERGWVGELRAARVVTSMGAVDLLLPGVLEPERGLVLRSRVRALSRSGEGDPFPIVALRVAAFVPVGVALRVLLRRLLPALVWVVGLAGLLLVAKVFAADRHPSLVDALWSTLGGLVGYQLGNVVVRRRAAA